MNVRTKRTFCLWVYVTEVLWVVVWIALTATTNVFLSLILHAIESPVERENIISNNAAVSNFSAWVDDYKAEHNIYENNTLFKEIDDICKSATTTTENWSLQGTSFFLVTVGTTIGYGNFAPTSIGAQVFIAIFCTPFFLLMLKTYLSFSNALVMTIKFALGKLCCANKGTFLDNYRKAKERIHRVGEAELNPSTADAVTPIEMISQFSDQKDNLLGNDPNVLIKLKSLNLVQTISLCSKLTKVEDDDNLDPELMSKLLTLFPTSDARVEYPEIKKVLRSHYAPEDRIKGILKHSDKLDRITLPMAISLAILYILLTAVIESARANAIGFDLPHGFWTAIWYSIITVTTVGLGDYTPYSFGRDNFNIPWLYLGLGLAVLNIDLLTAILGRCTKEACAECNLGSKLRKIQPDSDAARS